MLSRWLRPQARSLPNARQAFQPGVRAPRTGMKQVGRRWKDAGRMSAGLLAACILMAVITACRGRPSDGLVVSVASNLQPAVQELLPLIEQELGRDISMNVGASGKLAQQIEQGAPVDVFLSANVRYVDELIGLGALDPDSKRIFARGRLIIWTRDASLPLSGLQDLAQPHIRRIAIANPDHAPYGMAARDALQAAGLWQALQPKLILGENVTQSYQYADRGDVDVAIIPLSLVAAGGEGAWVDVPADLYPPLDQTAAVTRAARHRDAARRFIDILTSPAGRAILARNGYALPNEVATP